VKKAKVLKSSVEPGRKEIRRQYEYFCHRDDLMPDVAIIALS
jgi:hypothetical protein